MYSELQELHAAEQGLKIVVCPECGRTSTISLLEEEEDFCSEFCRQRNADWDKNVWGNNRSENDWELETE